MTESQAKVPLPFFDTALPISFVLPFVFQGKRIPMIWIGTPERQDVARAQSRLTVIGEHVGTLGEHERMKVYGETYPMWIYAKELHPDSFFLHISHVAPAFAHQGNTLPPIQAEYLLRYNLEQDASGLLLNSIEESLGCFLQFDTMPSWIQELVVPVDIDTVGWQGPRLAQLIRSSLPIYFSPSGFAMVKKQFDVWQRRREAKKQ